MVTFDPQRRPASSLNTFTSSIKRKKHHNGEIWRNKVGKHWSVRDSNGKLVDWDNLSDGTWKSLATPLDVLMAAKVWKKPDPEEHAKWVRRAERAIIEQTNWQERVQGMAQESSASSEKAPVDGKKKRRSAAVRAMRHLLDRHMDQDMSEDEEFKQSPPEKRKRSHQQNDLHSRKKTTVVLHVCAYEPWEMNEDLMDQIGSQLELVSGDLHQRLMLEIKSRVAPLVLERQRLQHGLDLAMAAYNNALYKLPKEERAELKRKQKEKKRNKKRKRPQIAHE